MTHRTFISLILAAALAVTGMTSTAAQASDKDVAKWIAGAVALGLIGAAIADERRDDRAVTRNRGYYNDNRAHGQRFKKKRRHGHKSHRKNRYDSHALPGHCRRVVQTRRGPLKGFGRHCLLNSYSNFNALPHRCAVRTRGHGNRGVIYGSYCLRQHGYRVSADRR